MTERLYYGDSYTTDFIARVTEHTTVGDRPAVVLDRTYFYPAGGGQPSDAGTINNVEVVEVVSRKEDLDVLHVLTGPISADEVECRVSWAYRFDIMQQHTGQHILTRAFIEAAGANTVAFHLGGENVTIDLDTPGLAPSVVDRVEDLANQIVVENRAVTARVVSEEEFADMNVRMRKIPGSLATDGFRVVEIEGFDVTACGGTHVARTGEIGMIKLLKLERLNERESRAEFRCGGRSLRDYRLKNAVIGRLAADLTVGAWEVDQAVARLKADLKETQRTLKAAQDRLLDYDSADLLASAPVRNGVRIVKAVLEGRDVAQARALVSRLIEAGDVIVLCGVPGEKAQVICGRSPELSQNMNAALKRALAALGTDRGGGRPEFAQGGGISASAAQIAAALDEAERSLSDLNIEN